MRYFTIIILILFAHFANAQSEQQPPIKRSWAPPNWDSIYKGTKYMPFSGMTPDGMTLTNESCKGKATYISFWFENCRGCREEFAAVNELYDSLKNDRSCVFIAITYDSAQILPEFIKKYDLHFPIATTNNHDIFTQLNYGMGCPGVVIIDRNGKVGFVGMKALTKNNEPGEFSISKAVAMVRKLE